MKEEPVVGYPCNCFSLVESVPCQLQSVWQKSVVRCWVPLLATASGSKP